MMLKVNFNEQSLESCEQAAQYKQRTIFLSNIIKLIDYLEIWMERREQENKNLREEEGGVEAQQNVNSTHKPFLSRLYSKTTPIGFQYHQVQVPPWLGTRPSQPQIQQQLNKRDISLRPQPTFLASRVKTEELDEFLNFVQSYYQEKIPDYFTTGTVSRERTRAQAMDFLHKMDYNYTKAKFYILFPYYLTYNKYRCHDPLSISLEDMEKKIKDHLEGLKNTKEKDMQKWVEILENSLNSKTKFQHFMSLIDQGKQNKYQIPQHIKQHIQKSQKIGRQLKRSIQGSKLSIQALRSKKALLQEYKLETPDMVSFQDSVNRCEQWIRKQKLFQQKYFLIDNGNFVLKSPEDKIQFRQMQLLVSEYSNLPLLCPEFQSSTKLLFQKTTELLENIPNISKIVKTRNAKDVTITKIPYKQMKDYLKIIQTHPVWHEDFTNFEINMRESLQLIERMNMYLEDPLSEKNTKTLNNYIKLMSDVQIQNNVEKRLRTRQECNDIIERIKKEITNPGKVQSIKQAFNKLKQKGIKEVEDLVYQQKILMYIGWHESQQKLKEPKIINSNMDIIDKELYFRDKLVSSQDYKAQLESAKKQWNITDQLIKQAYQRLDKNHMHLLKIRQLLADPNPNLMIMIEVLKQCIHFGLMFPELWQLHDLIVKYFIDIAKIHSLLKLRPQNLDLETESKFFFTPYQTDHIISIVVFPDELKNLKTKQKADELLKQIMQQPFPRYLQECKAFQQFMKKGERWAERVRQMIRNFTEKGDNIDVRELQDPRYFIHSKAIKEEIGKIQSIMRWRQKISKKLDDGRPELFSAQEQQFLVELERNLNNFELNGQNTSYKQLYLQYSRDNDEMIKRILHLIVNESRVENICKLSEMNKFHRQIEKENERHRIEDKKILQLKERFKDEIVAADDWKQKYLLIKRFEKKKILKKEEADPQILPEELAAQDRQMKEDMGNQNSPEHNQIAVNRKKYNIKNGEFSWYFKFLIMILQFSKGYKLKFCLEQLLKLKNSLAQIQKFITHYDKVFEKPEPFDTQLANLDTEASKIQVFIRQIWLLKKKNVYVNAWRIIADSILDSVPIINMQLKARKPQELLTVLANKKLQTEEAKKLQTSDERVVEPHPLKRQRKPNSLYFSSDITLYAEENPNMKPKKKKKGNNNDGEYRNTAVSSQAKKNSRNQLQEIQRTEAIIKAGVQAGTLTQDPKQYCICRYGEPNQNTTMIQCQTKCEQWFHIECIGIKKHQAKSDIRYTCIGCSTLYNLQPQGAFYWKFRNKMSQFALEQIVNQGRNLGVFTQQLKKINIIYEKMRGWKKEANELITSIVRDAYLGKQISGYRQKLYEIYLLSLWLPTYHYETSTIKRLLLLSRQEVEEA